MVRPALAPILAALAAAAPAAENALTPEEGRAGWILLFDGRSMDAWEDPSKEVPPGDAWTIENGCLRAVPRARRREDLLTRESFGDFELVFEWKISPGGNSGVKYRIQDRALLEEGKTKPGAKRFEELVDYELRNRLGRRALVEPGHRFEEYAVAFEYQLIDDSRHRDAQRGGPYQAGAVYGMVAPSRAAAKPPGEFNRSRILLRGNRVEHWLNGEKVVDTPLDSGQIRASIEKRWGRESKVYELLTRQPKRVTPVALQHHVDEAWFRNIRIRRLN